jgi:hypothetical protein
VIAKALAAIRDELAASARRTESRRVNKSALSDLDRILDRGATEVEIERALLATDMFPRAALLLAVFEGVTITDAAVLLDAGPDLIRKAQAIGAQELTRNLARIQAWTSIAAQPSVAHSETQYA